MSSLNSGVIVRPFRGFHPPSDLMQRMACPPFDVIESDEAREMAKGNEKSFLHVDKPEIDFPQGTNQYDDAVYKKGKENLDLFIKNKWLIQDEKPCLYIYSQEMKIARTGKVHVQYGIAAEVSAKQYEEKIIKIHEFTRPKKEDDRTRLTDTQSANASPVFLCYRGVKEINEIIENVVKKQQPYTDFISDDGIKHQLWLVGEEKLTDKISHLFAQNVPCLYVADGHHRTASAWRVYKKRREELEKKQQYTGNEAFNYFLAVVFPAEQLNILDYNRVVLTLNELSPDQFLEKLDEQWTYEPCKSVEKKETTEERENKEDAHTHASLPPPVAKSNEYRMYLHSKGWFTLKPKESILKEVGNDIIKSLDVSILSDFILAPILGIKDLRNDTRIDFVGGIAGLQRLQDKIDQNKGGVAFALYPTSVDQLMAIADGNKIMPPKSTWFEPKLRSGVVVRTF